VLTVELTTDYKMTLWTSQSLCDCIIYYSSLLVIATFQYCWKAAIRNQVVTRNVQLMSVSKMSASLYCLVG